MYVLVCNRVVKVNTGATEKFAPRSTNQTGLYVSGPFTTLKAAQRAMLFALQTHTCLDAQAWSVERVAAEASKGYVCNGHVKQEMLDKAMALLEIAKV